MLQTTELDDRYELRRVTPALDAEGRPDGATTGLLESMSLGFHMPVPTVAQVTRQVQHMTVDGVQLLGAYLRDPLPGSLDEVSPAGTFGWLRKPLSWGDGTTVDTFAVVGVTVRASERRRGVLRRMMTAALETAVSDGYPLASLTASEGTIYRRFGFGPAIRERSVEVQRARAVPFLGSTAGVVTPVPPATLAAGVGRAVYDRFHARTLGSMERSADGWDRLFGVTDQAGEPERSVRAAIHRPSEAAATDEADGYVTYKVVDDPQGVARVEVVDLVYATDAAYLALWEYLLAVDLTSSVRYSQARADDPVVHALADNRAFDVLHEEDHVWLRVLDPVAVLESRPWAQDGTLTISVTDDLGYASGTFRLTVEDGRGTVDRVEATQDADLSMDVAVLGQVLLGTVDPAVLADIGLVGAGEPAAPRLLHRMLVPPRTPHGISYF